MSCDMTSAIQALDGEGIIIFWGGWGSQLHLAGNYETASPHNNQPPHLCVRLHDADDVKKRSDRKGDVTNELDLLSGLSLSGVCS